MADPYLADVRLLLTGEGTPGASATVVQGSWKDFGGVGLLNSDTWSKFGSGSAEIGAANRYYESEETYATPGFTDSIPGSLTLELWIAPQISSPLTSGQGSTILEIPDCFNISYINQAGTPILKFIAIDESYVDVIHDFTLAGNPVWVVYQRIDGTTPTCAVYINGTRVIQSGCLSGTVVSCLTFFGNIRSLFSKIVYFDDVRVTAVARYEVTGAHPANISVPSVPFFDESVNAANASFSIPPIAATSSGGANASLTIPALTHSSSATNSGESTIDPLLKKVKLLLNGEEPGGVLDSVPTSWERTSGIVDATNASKFGSGSFKLLSGFTANHSLHGFQMLGESYTFEFQAKSVGTLDGSGNVIFRLGTNSFSIEWLKGSGTTVELFIVQLDVSGGVVATTTTVVDFSAWKRVVIQRTTADNKTTFWIDGTAVHSFTAANIPIDFVYLSVGGFDFDTNIDEFRVTDDARYVDVSGVSLTTVPDQTAAFSTSHEVADYGLMEVFIPRLGVDARQDRLSALLLPALNFQSYGNSGVSITLPRLEVVAFGSPQAQIALPSIRALAIGHDSTGDQAAEITLPGLTASITTGANASLDLPGLSSSSTGTGTLLASAPIELPGLTSGATGKVAGMASADISLPAFTSTSYSGAVCSVTIGAITTQATGTTGGVIGSQITLPLFEGTAVATAQARCSAAITLPSLQMSTGIRAPVSLPSLNMVAIGTAVVTATYEAYAVNLKHTPRGNELPVDEVTHYTNFPFTHVVRYKDKYYGANSTGLYLLEGATDVGTAIPWAVKTAMTDFKTPLKKTIVSAYFGGRFGPASTVQLHAGEKAPNTYSYSTPRGALAQNHRQMFGKGLKERYYALGASGTGVVELDSIELDVQKMTRRI